MTVILEQFWQAQVRPVAMFRKASGWHAREPACATPRLTADMQGAPEGLHVHLEHITQQALQGVTAGGC